MTLERITLEQVTPLLKDDVTIIGKGEASLYLSWRTADAQLAVQLIDLRKEFPITGPITHDDIFTTEGWLKIVDRTLREQKLYLGQVTFVGYSGFFRYPEIKGNLYEERPQVAQPKE